MTWSSKVETRPNIAAARLLKDFNYYFLVILAAPWSHTLEKGHNFTMSAKKMRTISCGKITFGRRIFIAFDFKPEQFNIYTADKPQLTAAETGKK